MDYVDIKLSAADGLRRKILELEERLKVEDLTDTQAESLRYILKDFHIELNNVEIELMRTQPWTKKKRRA